MILLSEVLQPRINSSPLQLLYYMVDTDPVALEHKRQMEELQHFIESKQLPSDLASRVVKHFEFQNQKAVENRASTLVPLPRFLISEFNCFGHKLTL